MTHQSEPSGKDAKSSSSQHDPESPARESGPTSTVGETWFESFRPCRLVPAAGARRIPRSLTGPMFGELAPSGQATHRASHAQKQPHPEQERGIAPGARRGQ